MKYWTKGQPLQVASLLVACSACGEGSNVGPIPGYVVSFPTLDSSTGARTASLRIRGEGASVSQEVVAQLASQVTVRNWPEGTVVSAAEMVNVFPAGTAGQQYQFGQIDRTLDDLLAGERWYVVSLASLPSQHRWQDESTLFWLDDRTRGVRISPSHPPVVARVMSCPKGERNVALYVLFSEPVTKVPGSISLFYGPAAKPCAMGADALQDTQFICTDVDDAEPFSVDVGDSVVGQTSGLPMVPGVFTSGVMQMHVSGEGCSIYKPTDSISP